MQARADWNARACVLSRRIWIAMRSTISVLILSAFFVLIASVSQAYIGLCCGKCGGNMPMNIPGGGIPETGEFRIKISPMRMHMDGLRDGTSSVRSKDVIAGGAMAAPTEMDMTMVNLSLGYSIRDDLFAGVMFMGKQNKMEMKFNSMMTMMTGQDGYSMESEGLGDTMLMLKYRLCADDPLIPKSQASLFFGLSLPTGSIDEKNRKHPIGMRQDELLPYGMQLGSGTYDPTLGFLYQGSSSPWWWGANLMFTGRFHDNKRDYRLGNELKLDLYGMYQLRHDLVAQIQLGGRYRGDIHGEMDEAKTGESGHRMQGNPGSPYMTPLWNPSNYGGRDVMATLGLQWQPFSLHILDLQVGFPLYQDLNGPQLEEDYRVMLTWYIEIPTKRSIRHVKGKSKPGKSRLGF